MCGIFGCVGKISEEVSYRCIKQIAHRGPDALAVKPLENITLAHARLSILDVSNLANQPMADASGRYWIVYNGEVYNFLELKEELELLGYRFRTNSDTEVVLYAYIEWGEKFQDKCNGMWSIAIWDDYEKSLFLSRDRFGIKPLYYYSQGNNFYFASEMKAFFPIMKKKETNYKVFYGYSFLTFEDSEECVIRNIFNFPAGCSGIFCHNELRINRWWNTKDHLIEVPVDYNEQVEMLRELFLDSCKIRMRSDVPIGTALSGGIDSSTVVGAMSHISSQNQNHLRQNKEWQNCFVASLPKSDIDETCYAECAAKYIGLNINKVYIDSYIAPEEMLREIYMCEVPYITSPIPFMQTYKAIRESGIKVTLDGHGADELFGGYESAVLAAGKEVNFKGAKFDELFLLYREMISVEDNRIFSKKEARETSMSICRNISKLFEKESVTFDEVNKQLYYETHNSVLPTLLRCYDRYSMSNGVEIRMPFLDYRIVTFAFSIPWTSKIRNGFSKSIVRDMAREFMHPKILNRKDKIGFSAPMDDWLRGTMKEFLLDTIHSIDFKQSDLINSLEVSSEVNIFLNNKRVDHLWGERIWQKIVPYLWELVMVKGQGM